MDRLFKSFIYMFIISLLFFVARILLLISYKQYFSNLNFIEILSAFINGIRFDFSILLLFTSIFFLIYNNPFFMKAWLASLLQYMLYFTGIGLFFFLICDTAYFQYVFRHIGSELIVVANDTDFITGMLFRSYFGSLIAFSFSSLVVFLFWKRVMKIKDLSIINDYVRFLLISITLVLGIRGTLSRKPINIIDAYKSGNTKISNLVLNGVFSAYHSSVNSKKINHNHYEYKQILDYLELPDIANPLLKNIQGCNLIPSNPNIIFFLLESWDYDYFDAFGGGNFGVTPNMDFIAKNGIKFTNFFSVGQRSIDGIQSTLVGIPPINGLPYLGNGLEISTYSKIGNISKKAGYSSIFIQSFKKRSFRLNSVSKSCGFDEYYGKEDVPIVYNYPNPKESQYGWDYDTLMFLKSKLDNKKEPFLAYVMTSTTHGPFATIDKQFIKYPHDKNGEGGFLNTLYYSDWSIGKFMESAKKTKWFENTIFIFCSDHTLKNFRTSNFPGHFRIPFLIYSPKYFKSGVNEKFYSQLDVMPTIASLFDCKSKIATIGESIFFKSRPYVFISQGNSLGIISNDGYLKHNGYNRMDYQIYSGKNEKKTLDELEKKILSFDQLHFKLWNENRFKSSDIL